MMKKSNVVVPAAEQLTQERGKTHGNFAVNAIISQGIKDFIRAPLGWQRLTNVQKEVLDVIALKMSRILSGQGMFLDHWADIGGYAELACQEIRRTEDNYEPLTSAAISNYLAGDQGGQGGGRAEKRTRARNVRKASRRKAR